MHEITERVGRAQPRTASTKDVRDHLAAWIRQHAIAGTLDSMWALVDRTIDILERIRDDAQSLLGTDDWLEMIMGRVNALVNAQTKPSQVDSTWTLRDEANALTVFAFRNGHLETLHSELPGFTDAEMKRLMIETSAKVCGLLSLRDENPDAYAEFLREQASFCREWEREILVDISQDSGGETADVA